MQPNNHLWVVILAAGEGKRVRDLTRDRWGMPAPKQYSLIEGRSTFLDATLKRARKLAPPERIVAVVARQHRRWWASELADLPARNVISQPENRGTAAGILLPLLWITRRDSSARLVILPSDHGVASEETLLKAISGAVTSVPHSESEMVLLGVQPEGPETGYGWIVPHQGDDSLLRPVASFREKPDAATATSLLSQGGLLNSFILIAGGQFLLELFKTAMPQLWRAFQPFIQETRGTLSIEHDGFSSYESIPNLDFSRDLLERASDKLWVYPVPPCGWLDLGTPERLTGHLVAQAAKLWDDPTAGADRKQLPEVHPLSTEMTEGAGGNTAYVVA